MNGREEVPGGEAGNRPAFERGQWRQLTWITFGAIAVYVTLRFLPTGTNLSHMDFRVDPKGGTSIEFCDPTNPQFIPVVAVRSPVVMTIKTAQPAVAGREVACTVSLRTASGKRIAPEDLLMTHTRPLHLMVVDASLSDYQHVHPQPGREKGDWTFSFTPRFGDTYRVFGDFMPAATGRGLYASVDLEVDASLVDAQERRHAEALQPGETMVAQDGYRFSLTPATQPLRAGQSIDFRFMIARQDGGLVALEPVMDSYAHLVAFDETRSGFAHLHPVDTVMGGADAAAPTMNFKLTIPRAGRYVIWAQVNVAGRETLVPFWIEVV